jgi:hypothetical protein
VDTLRRFRNSNKIRPYICYSHGTSVQAILLTLALTLAWSEGPSAIPKPKPKSKPWRSFLQSPAACQRSVETFQSSNALPSRPPQGRLALSRSPN